MELTHWTKITVMAVLCWLCVSVASAADVHVFTGPNGTTLEAEVLDFVDGKVVIRRVSDQQRFELPANRLAPADVEFMKAWLKAREASAHPLGWKTVRIHLPGFAAEVDAPGIPAAFRRIDVRTWEAELPEGAWVLITLRLEDVGKFAPAFLLPYEGSREWYLSYGDQRLSRALGPKDQSEMVGYFVAAQDSAEQLRELKQDVSKDGLALSSEYLEGGDFDALGKSVISAVVGEIDDFGVGKDAKLRALKMDEVMRETGGVSGWDELEFLDVRCSGDWPLGACAGLKGLTTLLVDGDVQLASASGSGSFPVLRHLSLEKAGIDDPGQFEAFASQLSALNSLSLPNEASVNLAALANCPELSLLSLGDECGDPLAKALSALSKMTVLLMKDNYSSEEIGKLVDVGHFSKLRTLGMGPRVTVPPSKFPQLRELWVKARGGAIDDAEDETVDFAALSLPKDLAHLQVSNATAVDLAAVAAMSGAQQLNSVVLRYPSIVDVKALEGLNGLLWLRIEDQLVTAEEKLETLDVSGFGGLRGLRLLRLQNLASLLPGAPSLEGLSIRSCSELKPLGASAESIADKVIVD